MTSEEKKEYMKRWYYEHPEYHKKWYYEHHEQRLKSAKKYRTTHTEKATKASKKWHTEHPGYNKQRSEYKKQWANSDHASIYEIVNIISGKRYIGSTTMNPKVRFNSHIGYIKTHSHMPLYNDILKFGIENFKMEVLFTCPKDQARLAEQFMINAFGGELYNQRKAR